MISLNMEPYLTAAIFFFFSFCTTRHRMFPIHSTLSTLSTLGSLSLSLPFIFYCNSICVVPHAFAPPTVERVGYVTPFASCIRYSRTAVQRASDERVWCVRARVYVLTRARPFITWSFVFSFSLPPFLLAQSIASQCSGNAQHNVWSFSLCKSTIFSLLKYGNVAMYDVRCIAWHSLDRSKLFALRRRILLDEPHYRHVYVANWSIIWSSFIKYLYKQAKNGSSLISLTLNFTTLAK